MARAELKICPCCGRDWPADAFKVGREDGCKATRCLACRQERYQVKIPREAIPDLVRFVREFG
jgi:hypothetical protein